jgi:cellulose synthase operon protein C
VSQPLAGAGERGMQRMRIAATQPGLVLRLGLALVWLTLGGAIVQADAGLDDYNLAVQLYRQNRWPLAAESFRKFLSDHPDHERTPFARLYLGLTLVNQADYKGARDVLRWFVKDYPQNQNLPQAMYRVAECSYLLNDLPAAKAELQAYLKAHPDDGLADRAWPYLGDVLLRLNEPEAAATAFARAVDQFPQGPLIDDAQFGWAKSLEAQKKYAEALSRFEKLANGDGPRAAEALFQVGNRKFDAGEFADAAAAYRQLPQRFPQHALLGDANLNAGFALYRLGEYAEAAGEFTAAAKSPQRAVTATYWRGLCLKSQGEFAAAIDLLKDLETQTQEPAQLEAILFQRGLCERSANRLEDAQQTLLAVADRFGKGEFADDALHFAAEMAIDAGQLMAAQERLDRFATEHPRSGLRMYHELLSGRLDLGRAAAELADGATAAEVEPRYRSAAEKFDRVLKDSTLDRTRWQARYYAALTRQLTGQHEQALELLKGLTAAVRTQPEAAEFADALVLEADSQMQAGQAQAALKSAQDYVTDFPQGRQAARALSLAALAGMAAGDEPAALAALDRLEKEFPKQSLTISTLLRLQEQAEKQLRWPQAAGFAQRLLKAAGGTDQEVFARRGLGWAQFQQKQFAEAAITFGELAQKFPEHRLAPEAAYYRAESLREAGDVEAALRAFVAAFESGRPQPPAAAGTEREPPLLFVFRSGLQAARIQRQQQQVDAADESYAALLAAFPQPEGLDRLLDEWALLNYEAERFDRADEIFRRIVAETPDSELADNAALSLAESDLIAGRLDAARQAFAQLRVSPQSDVQVQERSLFQLIVLALEQRRWSEIPSLAEDFQKSFPESLSRRYAEYAAVEATLAPVDLKSDALTRQLAALDKMLENPPLEAAWAPRLWVLKAETLNRLKQYDALSATVADFEQRLPGSKLAYQLYEVQGRALKQQAKFPEARKALEQAIATPEAFRTETAAKAQLLIAETYFLEENWQQAFLAYQKVYASYAYPEWQAAALLQSGKCDEQLGQWKEAAATYGQLLTEFPESPYVEEAKRRQQQARQRAGR